MQRDSQTKLLKKNMEKQAASAKELQHLQRSIPHYKSGLTRLQCRSHPLGAFIIVDSVHTGFETPHTFDNLAEGNHTVQMDYVSETGEIKSMKEEVELKKNKRVVCKLYFKTPKTLAEV